MKVGAAAQSTTRSTATKPPLPLKEKSLNSGDFSVFIGIIDSKLHFF